MTEQWREGSVSPEPGQWVLCYFLNPETGKASGPIISMPIHEDGSHFWHGTYIYAKTLWWMPLPPPPPELSESEC